jgi:hypothetical protein
MKIQPTLFDKFPDRQSLMEWHKNHRNTAVPEVNGHIHTPHSFSAFSDISLAFQMAHNENVKVLGINDFYTTDGYPEFAGLAQKFHIFPLFNIEFMALQNELQELGIRVNDPNNPGRTYFSGKGLRYPVTMSAASAEKIARLQKESNRQTYQMVEKLNSFFAENRIALHLDASKIHYELAKGLFRERHIAQAIRIVVYEKESSADGRKRLFEKIFSGKELISPIGDIALIENEIRGNLLKAGGAAFVAEDPEAFLSLEEVIDLIVDAGGIPCYPVLLDDPKGNFTDYEADKEKLLQELTKNNVWSLELIPGRNDCKVLKDFVSFFHQNNFVITFGTEHNTPQLDPLKVTCRGGIPLDRELQEINYEGAAVIAAHQYLVARGEEGYLADGKAKIGEKEQLTNLGKAVIAYFLQADVK